MEEVEAKKNRLNIRINGFFLRSKLQGYEERHVSALLLNPWRNAVRRRINSLLPLIGKDHLKEMAREHCFDGEYVDSYERECYTLLRLVSLESGLGVRVNPFYQKLKNLSTQWHFALKTGWTVKGGALEQMWKCGFNRPGYTKARNCGRVTCPFCNLFLSTIPLYSAVWDAVTKQDDGRLQFISLTLPPLVTARACEMVDTRGISTEHLALLSRKFDEHLDIVKGVIHTVLTTMSRKHETASYSWILEPEIVVCNLPADRWYQPPSLNMILEERLMQRGKQITDAAIKRMCTLWRQRGVFRLRLRCMQIMPPCVQDSWAQAVVRRLVKRFSDKEYGIDKERMLTVREVPTCASASDIEKVITVFARLNTSWLDGVEFYSQIHQLSARNKGGNCYRANFPLPSFEEFLEWKRQQNRLPS